jgi:dynein heavy chain
MKSWLNSFAVISAVERDKMEVFFLAVYEPVLKTMRTMDCSVRLNDNQLFKSFALLANEFMTRLADPVAAEALESKDKLALADQCFLFALIWSLGMVVADNHLKHFDLLVKKSIKTPDKSVPSEVWKQFRKVAMPETGSVFDHQLRLTGPDSPVLAAVWSAWCDSPIEEQQVFVSEATLSTVVPLADHSRYLQLLGKFNKMNQCVIVSGGVGAGKSLLVELFKNKADLAQTLTVSASFTRGTTPLCFNSLVNKAFTRKLNHTTHFPLDDKSRVLFMIEDLNLGSPSPSTHASALEFVRFLQETSSFYDLEDPHKALKQVTRPALIGTCTAQPPNEHFSPRLLSQFCLLTVRDLEEESLSRVFSVLIGNHFDESFSASILQKVPKLVVSLVEVVRESRKQLPKGRAGLSIRDMLRMADSLCCCQPTVFKSLEDVFKLFVSECWNQVGAKLASEEDQLQLLNKVIRPVFAKHFSTNFELAIGFNEADDDRKTRLLAFSKRLLFTDLSFGDFNPKRQLTEVVHKGKLLSALTAVQDSLSAEGNTHVPLHFFNRVVETVVRIGRVLGRRNGHLMAVEANQPAFRKVLEFACLVCSARLVEMPSAQNSVANQWEEVVSGALIDAAMGKKTVVYLTEDSMREEAVVDLVGMVVNNNSVFNLLSQEQLEAIVGHDTAEGSSPRSMQEVLQSIQANLHLVALLSPDSGLFQRLLSDRPSLVSCFQTTLSTQWPEESLRNSASVRIAPLLSSPELQASYENVLVQMHNSVTPIYEDFSRKRHASLTNKPEHFEVLLSHFVRVFREQTDKWSSKARQLQLGLDMLTECEDVVLRQQEKLEALRPILDESNERVSLLVASIEDKAEAAGFKEQSLQLEEQRMKAEADTQRAIFEECQYEVELLQPELDKARDELMKVTKADLDFLNQMKNPHVAVQNALQALCLLLNAKPEIKRDAVTGRHSPDWWATSKALLNSLSIDTLLAFDEARMVTEEGFGKLVAFVEDPKIKESLEEKVIKFSSPTAFALFAWVSGQMNLHTLNGNLMPKRKALEEANANLAVMRVELADKTKEFEEAQRALAKLRSDLTAARAEKQKAEKDIETLLKKVDFAKRLLEAVPDEKKRWEDMLRGVVGRTAELPGHALLTAGFMAYLGVLDMQSRAKAMEQWREVFVGHNLVDHAFSVTPSLSCLFPPVRLQEWVNEGLSNDRFSMDNAIMIDSLLQPFFLIDPHGQGKRWVSTYYKSKTVKFTSLLDPLFNGVVLSAVVSGHVLVIEDASLPLPKSVDDLLKAKLGVDSPDNTVQFIDECVTVHPDFRVVLLAKRVALDNPTYDSSVLAFLNYEVTKEGLCEQLLSQMVTAEKPQLEQSFQECLCESAKIASELEGIECQLLEAISGDKSNILEDQSVIGVLLQSKLSSQFFNEKQAQLAETYAEVLSSRREYQELAARVASLFALASNFARLNPMYSISLEAFVDCLSCALSAKHTSRSLSSRLSFIENTFLGELCRSVCKGLFAKDKLIFVLTTTMLLESLQTQQPFNHDLLNFLLIPADSLSLYVSPNTQFDWICPPKWKELHYLASCSAKFKDLCLDEAVLKQLADLVKPDNTEWDKLPDAFEGALDPFERFCLLTTMHPQHWQRLAQAYLAVRTTDTFLKEVFDSDFPKVLASSSLAKPVLLLVKDGQDPVAFLNKHLSSKSTVVEKVIVGKRQTDAIVRVLEESMKNGNWVLLQTFSHEPSVWAVLLQKMAVVRSPNFEVSRNFRFVVSCTSDAHIPVSVLLNSLHFALEEPFSFKRALRSILDDDLLNNQEFHDSCDRKKLLQQMSMSLCAIHAALQTKARMSVGGFNWGYRFTSNDFKVSLQQLQVLLSKLGDDFSIEIIQHFMTECNYGAKVTSEGDKRLLTAVIQDYLSYDGLKMGKLRLNPNDDSNDLLVQDTNSRDKVVDLVESLADDFDVEVAGLSELKGFQSRVESYNYFREALTAVFSTARVHVSPQTDYMSAKVMMVFQGLPGSLDVAGALKRFPQLRSTSNMVLMSEVEHSNALLTLMKQDLEAVLKAVNSSEEPPQQLKALMACIDSGKVPQRWQFWSFSAQLAIPEFISCFNESHKFFSNVLSIGRLPDVVFPGAFAHPKAFVQSIKMNFAAENSVDLNVVSASFVLHEAEAVPDTHSVLFGPFGLHYASYNYDEHCLTPKDSKNDNQQVTVRMELSTDPSTKNESHFECPAYIKQVHNSPSDRRSVCCENLFEVRIKCEESANFWIKAGAKLVAFKS